MTNYEIIKKVYALDDQGHYTNDTIHNISELPDYLLIEILKNHSSRFFYLLFSRYTGRIYKPERFERMFK